jgi:uncharacterized protein (TIGR02246 family)
MKPVRILVCLGALCAALPALPVLAQEAVAAAAPQSVPMLAQRYAEAWASRDAERIVALHSDDSTFALFVDGVPTAAGKAAIKAQFHKILADNPTYQTTVRSAVFGADSVVIEYDIRMDPPRPFTLGNTRYVPTGRPYSIPAIDLIQFRSGMVTVKHTYLDTAVARANSQSAEPIGRTQ